MMDDRPVSDDFDATLRRALSEVSTAVSPDPDLAARLVANAREGRPAVVRLDSRRHVKRWALPLLAAASIVALVVGGAVATNLLADSDKHPRPQQSNTLPPISHAPTPSPTPISPTPTTTAPPAVPHFKPYAVDFLDADRGWALGDAQCATGAKTDCPTLVATTDGGASWHRAPLPDGLVSPFKDGSCMDNGGVSGPCVEHLLFADRSNGYLWSVHEFYWTTDGGRSWTRETHPVTGYRGSGRIAVVGHSIVRLAPLAGCSVPCAGEVETAPIGSSDWQITTPGRKEVAWNTSTLLVVGRDVYLFAGGTFDNASIGIFRSRDGGSTWQRVAHDVCGHAADGNSDRFYAPYSLAADDGSLVVTCLGRGIRIAAPGTTKFSPLRPFPATLKVSLQMLGAESDEVMTALFTNIDAGPEDPVTIYRTADGGRTWQAGPALSPDYSLPQFQSGKVGYVTGPGNTLIVTHDGGLTWNVASFPG